MNHLLAAWNALPHDEAAAAILPCCGSTTWAATLAAQRPFLTPQALTEASDAVWRSLPPEAWHEAFASHPRLGERHAPTATPRSLAWSAAEQSAANPGDAAKLALAQANQLYEQRFGRTFIVCATGKTTSGILEALNRRLRNTPEQEIAEAAEQQRLITHLRLNKWLGATTLSISTHIVDTASGRPAANVPVELARLADDAQWHPLSQSTTDPDGRRRFPAIDPLTPGTYRIRFDTAAHYAAQNLTGLYPWVEIAFTVSPGETHYHIPLLLTANGYTTYRGS